jgi:hypothetical protein
VFRADRATISGADSPRLAGRQDLVHLETVHVARSGSILLFTRRPESVRVSTTRQARDSYLLGSQSNARQFLPCQHIFQGDKSP